LKAKAYKLLSILPCEPITEAASDFYSKIKLTRQQKGLTLDENDLWIAATALAIGAILISRDNDFQYIEGLKVEDWTL
jgi:tRNA(fMet)-specific endonuclease VapC